MNLMLSDFNSLAAVLLTRHSARSQNIGLQLQPKFVYRRRRRCRYYHPRVSAYDSSVRTARERREWEWERERERGRAGRRRMRPPDQCSGGSGHDARRSRRGASRRWRAGKPTRRKAWMRKAQSTSGILARNPDTRCALPGNHRRDARRPLHRAGILAGVRNTHVRPLNFARLNWPDERGRGKRQRAKRVSRRIDDTRYNLHFRLVASVVCNFVFRF